MTDNLDWHFPLETTFFLQELARNNTRDWFRAHKSQYTTQLAEPAGMFATLMQAELTNLCGMAHGARIFRINRDLRFSRDKAPYNAHLHILFQPLERTVTPPRWFFGYEPGQLTLGAGVFAFDKPGLERFRQRVAGAGGPVLMDILDDMRASGIVLRDPELKRIPAGFDADHRAAGLLRHKGLSVWLDIAPEIAVTPGFLAACRAGFAQLKPVFDWLDQPDA